MVVCNTVPGLRKKEGRLITYSSGTYNTQIEYILARNKDRKLVKDVKVISSEEIYLNTAL